MGTSQTPFLSPLNPSSKSAFSLPMEFSGKRLARKLHGEGKKIPLHFYAAHDIIRKVSPETRLAIYRIEAVIVVFPFAFSILRCIEREAAFHGGSFVVTSTKKKGRCRLCRKTSWEPAEPPSQKHMSIARDAEKQLVYGTLVSFRAMCFQRASLSLNISARNARKLWRKARRICL
jgi:hypothetical protein